MTTLRPCDLPAIIGWPLAIGVFVVVAVVATCVVLYRRHVRGRAEQARIAHDRCAAEVRGLAYVDPTARCGWCGWVHREHPAVFHAVSVVERIENIAG
jgi:hypothetical protein